MTNQTIETPTEQSTNGQVEPAAVAGVMNEVEKEPEATATATATARKRPTPLRKRKTAPKDETREMKFSRLASARTIKAIRAIHQLTTLASPAYVFSEDQVNAIDAVLAEALEESRSAMIRRLKGSRGRHKREVVFSV